MKWLNDKFDKPPIVIGGCGRSGTTLLLSILSSHPEIFAVPEETAIFVRSPFNVEPLIQHLTQCEKHYANRWCEKTPSNIERFDFILRQFADNVQLINVIRDGRDVVTSHHPRRPNQFWVDKRRWINNVAIGLKYQSHPSVLTIRYEDLVLDYSKTMMKICGFLNIKFGNEIQNWFENCTVRSHTAWFAGVFPIDAQKAYRWKQDKDNPATKKIIDDFMKDSRAAKLLAHYGYDL